MGEQLYREAQLSLLLHVFSFVERAHGFDIRVLLPPCVELQENLSEQSGK